MSENDFLERAESEGVYSKALRAGRRTYFFDVRETKAGDYYLTITESKKSTNQDGTFSYKKHKIYLYKEDFESFREILDNTTSFVINEKGEEVISERHQRDFEGHQYNSNEEEVFAQKSESDSFTDLNFEDI